MKLSEQAERATLGAILHEPDRADEIADQLTPSDFYRPYHRAVWAAILRLREQGRKPTPGAIRGELPQQAEIAAHIGRDGIPLVELMQAAPRPGSLRRYVDMVAEASLHRRVDLLGQHLAHVADAGTAADMATEARSGADALAYVAARNPAARISDDGHDQDPKEVRHEEIAQHREQLDTIRAETRQAAAAGDQHAGRLAKVVDAVMHTLDSAANWAVEAPTPPSRGGREHTAPTRYRQVNQASEDDCARIERQQHEPEPQQEAGPTVTEQEPAPDPGRVQLEDRILSSLTADPRQLETMTPLDPGMFTAPGRRGLFDALTRSHHPDELSVLWDAQRAGTLAGIDVDEARAALSDGVPGDAGVAAADLGQHAARDEATHTAATLRQAAADPAQDPGQFLADTRQTLDELEDRCQRYDQAGTARHTPLDLTTTDEGDTPAEREQHRRPKRQTELPAEPDQTETRGEIEPDKDRQTERQPDSQVARNQDVQLSRYADTQPAHHDAAQDAEGRQDHETPHQRPADEDPTPRPAGDPTPHPVSTPAAGPGPAADTQPQNERTLDTAMSTVRTRAQQRRQDRHETHPEPAQAGARPRGEQTARQPQPQQPTMR